MKVVYGMGLTTAKICQTLPIKNKLFKLYLGGVPDIGPFQTLVLDATGREKVLIKNLTPEDVQTGFTNRHTVGQHLERVINVTKDGELMKIAPIPSYFIFYGF